MKHSDNLYHTMEHIDDVVCFVRLIIASIYKKQYCYPSQQDKHFENNLVIAAYMHDLGHPMNEPREILENLVHKKSVEFGAIENTIMSNITIERLHAELFKAECGPLIRDDDMGYILELIESTNLQTYTIDHKDLGKTIIRCADLSNFTDVWEKHKRSTRRLCDEMNINMCPQKQVDFIERIVLPQFRLLYLLIKTPESKAWIVCVNDNLSMWKNMLVTESMHIYPDKSICNHADPNNVMTIV
jgi:hypothetical protein